MEELGNLEFKKAVIEQCKREILEKISLCENSLKDIKSDISNETKSSAGDKFETSREMMQQEREKNEMQLQKLWKTLNDLYKIGEGVSQKIENGTLIRSGSKYIFFFSGLGNISFKGNKIYIAAITSPIGQKLKGMTQRMRTNFNGMEYSIDEIC